MLFVPKKKQVNKLVNKIQIAALGTYKFDSALNAESNKHVVCPKKINK